MKVETLKLPRHLQARLLDRARRTGRSKSAVMREAIAAYLEDRVKPRRPSFADGARDLVGCVEGPSDLSTNPSYLDDLGR
jgi:hypothetical protein